MTMQDPGATRVDDYVPLGLNVADTLRPADPEPKRSFVDVVSAAFQNDNTLVSAVSALADGADVSTRVQQGYSAWEEIKGTPYEQYWSTFVDADNPAMTAMFKARIDREMENDRTLASAGVGGFVASLAAGIIDPTILVPVGGGIRAGAQGAWSVSRSALAVGAAGFAGSTLQEGLLQTSQETRTLEESAINIGAGTVLSGILGAGAAAVLNRVTRQPVVTALDDIITGQASARSSIGAEAVERATLDDLSMSVTTGFAKPAEAIARASQIVSPNLQAQFSPSPAARQFTQMLTEGTLYQRMNDEGRSLGAAAETLSRVDFESRTGTAMREVSAIFAEAKKNGVNMSRVQFEEAVGKAMRRGDESGNAFVDRAAQAYRKNLADPFQNDALAEGLLDEADIQTKTAKTYFPRQYNQKLLRARPDDFKTTVAGWYEQQLASEFQSASEALTNRIARVEQRLKDLRLGPAERVAALGELDVAGQQLDAANAVQVERVSTINDLRAQKKAASSAGDRALAQQLQSRIEAEQAAGGEQLKSYLADRRRLRQRRRDVDLNFAGFDARHEKVMQSLVDLEEANISSLNRLVEKGRRFERQLQKLDPEQARAKMSELRTSFMQIAEKADRALDRQAEALRKMEADAQKAVADGTPVDTATAARDAAQRARIEKEIAAQRNRSERMSALARRMEAADEFDYDASVRELRTSVDDMVREVSDLSFGRGEKAQRLKERLAALDPETLKAKERALEARKVEAQKRFDEQWRASLDEDGVSFRNMAQEIAEDAYAKVSGTNYGEEALSMADMRVPVTRGPLKDRTLNVPDELIEDFLDSNVTQVMTRYARTMAGEIALTRRFGRADMRDQVAAISQEYRELIDAVPPGPKAEKARIDLAARRDLDIKNLTAMRDLIRGTLYADANNGNLGRGARSLMTFNYIRSMGGAAISSLSDLFRPGMVHGYGAYLNEGLLPMLTNMSAVKASRKDAELFGLVMERHTQHRLASMVEMGDPYKSGTPIERLLDNGARIGSKWNGLTLLTDFSQGVAATLSQNRILAAATDGRRDLRLLAYLGIDKDMATRIAAQFAEHGETDGTIKVANTTAWTDDVARKAYAAAVSKDVNSVVVLKSVGDVPLLANHPTGKLLLQFRTFALASHQRVLLRGLQEKRAAFVSGMVVLTAMGVAVRTVAAWRSGEAAWERFKAKVGSNPGFLVGEGLDASGIFSLGVEVSNMVEVATRPTGFSFNPIKSPFLAAGAAMNPEASAQAASGRVQNRGFFGAVAGPSVGLLDRDLPDAMSGAARLVKGEKTTDRQNNAMRAVVPFGSYLGFKEVIQAAQDDSPYAPQ